MKPLPGWLSPQQAACVASLLRGEEGEHFAHTLSKLEARIELMPETYTTDGQGKEAVAYLHYFIGGCDWWITEKDKGAEGDTPEQFQSQAFGMVDLGYGAELGYISIPELRSVGAELDFYWTPKSLAMIEEGRVSK